MLMLNSALPNNEGYLQVYHIPTRARTPTLPLAAPPQLRAPPSCCQPKRTSQGTWRQTWPLVPNHGQSDMGGGVLLDASYQVNLKSINKPCIPAEQACDQDIKLYKPPCCHCLDKLEVQKSCRRKAWRTGVALAHLEQLNPAISINRTNALPSQMICPTIF